MPQKRFDFSITNRMDGFLKLFFKPERNSVEYVEYLDQKFKSITDSSIAEVSNDLQELNEITLFAVKNERQNLIELKHPNVASVSLVQLTEIFFR